jgi:hypothetical protein
LRRRAGKLWIKYNAGMFFKRLIRKAVDILDSLSRLDILWKLVTLTKAGQLVLAGVAAIAIFAVALGHSDPWVSAITFALIGFAVVAVITQLVFKLTSRPRLEYKGITGTQFAFGDAQFGTEEGGFMWGESFLQPLLVRIANTQQDIDVSANNVTALIRYRHHDKRDETTVQAAWLVSGSRGGLVDKVQIESGETAHVVMVYTYPPTPNQQGPNAKRTNDFLATGNLFKGSPFKKFSVGHWSVFIEVKSDNSAPLLLKGGFTVTRDERIPLDTPALRKIGAWG